MRSRNGATFAELAVLRALHAVGGEAAFADLARTDIRAVEKVLRGMLPAKSRPNTTGRKTSSGAVRAGRGGLVGRFFKDGRLHYRIAPSGMAGAVFTGPWTQKTARWSVEWTPERVVVTGEGGGFVGRLSESGIEIAGVMDVRMRPDRAAWRSFRGIMKERLGVNVPAEAVPDFVRFGTLLDEKKGR